jgi:hypothetical protein
LEVGTDIRLEGRGTEALLLELKLENERIDIVTEAADTVSADRLAPKMLPGRGLNSWRSVKTLGAGR